MGIDAVALLRVKSRQVLRERLLEAGVAESLLVPLNDGSALLSTLVRFGDPRTNQPGLRLMLTRLFEGDLPRIHDDPRGVLVFPDVCEPRGRSYDAVVAEVEAAGVWVSTEPLSSAELAAEEAGQLAEVNRLMADPSALQAELKARLGLPEMIDLAAIAAHLESRFKGDEGAHACVLIEPRSPLPKPLPDSNAVHALADGAQAVVTTRFAGDFEMIAMQLGNEHAAWLAGHRDARGVCVFGDRFLTEVLAAGGYDEAVDALGDHAHWVKPKTLDELMGERASAAKAFLDDK